MMPSFASMGTARWSNSQISSNWIENVRIYVREIQKTAMLHMHEHKSPVHEHPGHTLQQLMPEHAAGGICRGLS